MVSVRDARSAAAVRADHDGRIAARRRRCADVLLLPRGIDLFSLRESMFGRMGPSMVVADIRAAHVAMPRKEIPPTAVDELALRTDVGQVGHSPKQVLRAHAAGTKQQRTSDRGPVFLCGTTHAMKPIAVLHSPLASWGILGLTRCGFGVGVISKKADNVLTVLPRRTVTDFHGTTRLT